MLLVEFKRDWADEFDVYGLAIMTRKQYDNLIAFTSSPRSYHFGSNEGWEDEVLADSFRIAINENNTAIAAFTNALKFYKFGVYKTWGHFPDFDELYDEAEDLAEKSS